jgi:hypothetical protein
MNVQWDETDSEKAQKQGWDIFYNCSSGVFEIERVDELQLFPDDFAVVIHLTKEALKGDNLAIRALALNWQEVCRRIK